jgi:hypothetical protein
MTSIMEQFERVFDHFHPFCHFGWSIDAWKKRRTSIRETQVPVTNFRRKWKTISKGSTQGIGKKERENVPSTRKGNNAPRGNR